ncbi:MAG: purine-nucleoside phosphorylase [Bacteroidia bacterium]
MSMHLEARPGDISPAVLLAGDPLRAQFIAETYLDNPVCYNRIRGMYGYTGTYRGQPVSVQGTGIGMPSQALYVHELIVDYGVQTLLRVGTCGALQPGLQLRDIVLAQSASTDSSMIGRWVGGLHYAPSADFGLLYQAYRLAQDLAQGQPIHVGSVLSTDTFYDETDSGEWRTWAAYGVLAVEMESAALYTLAARYGVRALCLLTVSDHLVTGAAATAQDRQTSYTGMIETALALATGQ